MYCFATDPLLLKLNKILKGLTYFSHPTCGPHHPLFGKPKPVVEKLTAIGFVDDVKGFLTSVEEFHILDKTLASFEAASGSRLHRSADPTNQKCAVLPLGRWAGWSSADCPLDYMKVVDHINLLGVKLAHDEQDQGTGWFRPGLQRSIQTEPLQDRETYLPCPETPPRQCVPPLQDLSQVSCSTPVQKRCTKAAVRDQKLGVTGTS